LGVALGDLAAKRVVSGTVLIVATLLARWMVAEVFRSVLELSEGRLRQRAHVASVDHLSRANNDRAAGFDVDLAIDQASQSVTLRSIGAGAALSPLGVGLIWWFGGWLSAVITLLLVALSVPFYIRAGQRSAALSQTYQRRRATLFSRQLAMLRNVPELRALGAVDYGATTIGAATDVEHVAGLAAIRVALSSSLVSEFLGGVSVGLVAMVVGFALLGGRISLSHALIAVLVTSETFALVRRYGAEFHRRDDAQRAVALLTSAAVRDTGASGSPVLEARELVVAGLESPVSFRLTTGQRALVEGRSGAGKTSLLETLLGGRSPEAGTRTTSGRVGLIRADGHLLAGSLRENLRSGGSVSDEAIVALLSELNLRERFASLDDELVDNGRNLSTGERVRLLVARALLADCQLLVLDDVAGVLDAASREALRTTIGARRDVATLEAASDRPLLDPVDVTISLEPSRA